MLFVLLMIFEINVSLFRMFMIDNALKFLYFDLKVSLRQKCQLARLARSFGNLLFKKWYSWQKLPSRLGPAYNQLLLSVCVLSRTGETVDEMRSLLLIHCLFKPFLLSFLLKTAGS